jgi:hypothetical protein
LNRFSIPFSPGFILSISNVIFLRATSTAQVDGNNSNNQISLFEYHYILGFGYSSEDAPDALSVPVCSTASEAAYRYPGLAVAPQQGRVRTQQQD